MEDVIQKIRDAARPLLETEAERVSFDVRAGQGGRYDVLLGGSVHTLRPKQVEWTAREGSWPVLVDGALKRLRRLERESEPVFRLVDVYGEIRRELVAVIAGTLGEKEARAVLAREEAGLEGLAESPRLKVLNERLSAWIVLGFRKALEGMAALKVPAAPPARAEDLAAERIVVEKPRRSRRVQRLAEEGVKVDG